MISINDVEIAFTIDELNDVIDYAYNLNQIYLLSKDHTVTIIDYMGNYQSSIKLENTKYLPTCIIIDFSNIYIGYTNGTIEILGRNTPFETRKITSPDDAGGPGDPTIGSLMASQSYLFANTAENGVLIYLQPSLLFYKWIMIELETSIVAFSFNSNLLFVLVKDGSIHCLDFQIQRLDEIPIGGYAYIDIEFQNGLLYLISKQFLHIYAVSENIKLIYSYRESFGEILRIKIKKNRIFLLLTNGNLRSIVNNLVDEDMKFEVSEPFNIDENFSIKKFEKIINNHSNILIDDNPNKLDFIYMKNDKFINSKIKFP